MHVYPSASLKYTARRIADAKAVPTPLFLSADVGKYGVSHMDIHEYFTNFITNLHE